jgi:hypothetical protein
VLIYLSYYNAAAYIAPIPRLYAAFAIVSLFYFYVDIACPQEMGRTRLHNALHHSSTSKRTRVCMHRGLYIIDH